MLDAESDLETGGAAEEEIAMLPCAVDDDDDEPEVTSSTRLIDDTDCRDPPLVVRRRVAAVSSGRCQTATRRASSVAHFRLPSPSSANPDDSQCCCCCCSCDAAPRAPRLCHCRCPPNRRYYFRSGEFPSDDDDDAALDDDESACSCCHCDGDMQRPTTPPETGKELLHPVAATKLSSIAPGSNSANGQLPLRSPTKVAPSAAGGGLSSFFAFLRSRGRFWSAVRPRPSSTEVVDSRRRRRGQSLSALPPCTCGLGLHFDPPLSVAQQVKVKSESGFFYSVLL